METEVVNKELATHPAVLGWFIIIVIRLFLGLLVFRIKEICQRDHITRLKEVIV
jgi:hypothetical protein